MTLSREWLQFELFVQNTGRAPVGDSGARSAWVWEDTQGFSPGVRVSSQEAEFRLPVRGEGGSEGASLVGAESLLLSTRPVEYDEREAHRHEHKTQRCETSGLEDAENRKDVVTSSSLLGVEEMLECTWILGLERIGSCSVGMMRM